MHECVHVVRHDAPGKELVRLLVEVQQQGTELGQLQLKSLEDAEKGAPAPPESEDASTTTALEPAADTTSALVGP